jgi:Uma2 family endonuclease
MSQALANWADVAPDVHQLITEDDEPVDNLPSEKQQRLLTETLYSSWNGPGEGRTFLAAANIGVFYLARRPAIVPDVLLSLDVEVPENWWEKEHRSYFLWEFGKPPDLAIEIVSNSEGGEDGDKKLKYARMRVPYYVIYDPQLQIMADILTVYRLQDFEYERQESATFPTLGLGLVLWEGKYEGKETTWLRWINADGEIVLSGKERAQEERQRAEEERQRAEEERQRAEAAELRERQTLERAQQAEMLLEQERQRAERLAAMLRQLGKEPD